MFVVDSSTSVRGSGNSPPTVDNWAILLKFVSDFVIQFTISSNATRVGLVKFSNLGETVFYLSSNNKPSDLAYAIKHVSYVGGNTNTSGGIGVMRIEQFSPSRGDRKSAADIAIIITDGASNWNRERTIPEAEMARKKGVEIIVIGITSSVNETEIRYVSSSPHAKGKNYFLVDSFADLKSLIELSEIYEEVCHIGIYALVICMYAPPPPPPHPWRGNAGNSW